MIDDEHKLTLENSVNSALDESIEELSPDVRRRLTMMRTNATQTKERLTWFDYAASWKTATAFSLVLTVTVSWTFWPNQVATPMQEVADLSPFAEVLQEDLEMLNELEFVYWLAEENDSETATL